MDNLFSLLYDTVFPWLGKFFGQLAGFASATTQDVFDSIFGLGVKPFITYTNVFTGKVGLIPHTNVSDVLSYIASETIGNYIGLLGIGDLPFWLGLLILLSSVLLAIIAFKMIWKFLKSTFL